MTQAFCSRRICVPHRLTEQEVRFRVWTKVPDRLVIWADYLYTQTPARAEVQRWGYRVKAVSRRTVLSTLRRSEPA